MIGAAIAKRKVRSTFASLNKSDLHAFFANLRDDVVFVYPGSTSASGTMQGKKAVEKWFERFMEQFSKVDFTLKSVSVQNIFALGGTNVAAAEWDVALTNRVGQDFQNKGVTIIHI
jgi:ketosteroid isomerase-like protein